MRGFAPAQLSLSARRLVLWWLLVALPVYGLSSSIVALLGASHYHRDVAAAAVTHAMDGWQDLRRGAGLRDAALPVHSHALLQRHSHAQGDSSVVTLDGGAGDGLMSGGAAEASAGSATLLALGAADPIEIAAPCARPLAWARFVSDPLKSCDSQRIERPPRA